MIIKAAGYVFHEHYLAFHVHRENAYCPWKVVGVYVSYNGKARCKYMDDFKHIEHSYANEAKHAGPLCGTYDFLSQWRRDISEHNSCITRIVKYYSTWHNPGHILHDMCHDYLGTNLPYKMARIAIMLKSHEGYFPIVFQLSKRHSSIAAELKKAKLYDIQNV